jgi:hypothetical protein
MRFEALLDDGQYRHLVVLRLRTPCDPASVLDQLNMRPVSKPAVPELRALSHGTACYGASMAITADQREALRMLAGSPNGSTESIMLAHGFAIGMLRDLVRNGLATAERRKVRTGQRLIGVKWMTITDAGRRALAP